MSDSGRARHLEVVRLVLLGDADLDERVELGAVAAAVRVPPGRRPRRRRTAGSAPARYAGRASRGPGAPSRASGRLQPLDRRGRRPCAYSRDRASASSVDSGTDAAPRRLDRRTTGRAAASSGVAEQDQLVAEADEARLHEQLDVVVDVRAGHVEADRPALARRRAAGAARGGSERRRHRASPTASSSTTVHSSRGSRARPGARPRDVAAAVVDVHQVVRGERAQRQPEQAEHADRGPGDRQARASGCRRRRPGPAATARRGRRDRSAAPRGPCRRCVAIASAARLPARRVGWGRRPTPSPGSACSAAIVATRRWKRVSPASSGWNAVAMTLRSRTATIRPSSSLAMTSTSGPTRSITGARMKTPWTGWSPSRGTDELRLERVQLTAERVALDGHVEQRQDGLLAAGDLAGQEIIPAQVPKSGAPAAARSRIGWRRPQRSMRRRIVVLSPPGRTRPSMSSRSAGRRTSTASTPIGAQRRDVLGEGALDCQDTDLHGAGSRARRRRAYQPRTASRSSSGMASIAMPAHRRAEALGDLGDDLRVVEVGRRLDDGVGHPRRVLALEDAGADEHALGAQLHHQRRVGRGADAAGDEVHDRQPAVSRRRP